MTNFKLIAITPLADCHESYRKKLPPGQPNLFYNGYEIILSADKKEVVKVTRPAKPVPLDLYELENGISLSISAVVGKNGSGKSTIFELFFYAIYAIYTEKYINNEKILTKESEDIKYTNRKFKEEILLLSEHLPKLKTDATSIAEFWPQILPNFTEFVKANKIEFKPEDYTTPYSLVSAAIESAKLKHHGMVEYIKVLEEEETGIKNGLAVSIIYESEGIVRELLYDAGKFRYNIFDPNLKETTLSIDEFNPEEFFYTICVNYSHHGLNSNFIGTWINKLFHKNDAYRTPVVINPMRNEGNFDINREQHLAKERLMANILHDLLHDGDDKLLDKYSVDKFVFSPKIKNTPLLYPFELEKLKAYPLLQKIGINNNVENLPFFDLAISYLENKINKINQQYHFIIYDNKKSLSKAEQLKQFIKDDDSHITKKIRQTLNFLETSLRNKDFWSTSDLNRIVLSRKKMLKWLAFSIKTLDETKPNELIEYGLPGFFHIDFVLGRDLSGPIEFSSLSSGEQQNILNINAILYHLYNLNSVQIHDENDENKKQIKKYGRILYRDVNIILDEVELYYHPEMQRRVVSELISSFEKIKHKNLKGIQGINVTILTHSPFILSDIPNQNVLSLTDETSQPLLSESTKTFGGNIHEILMEQFFMDSTMGEHSINVIQQLLDLYKLARHADAEHQIEELQVAYLSVKEKYKFACKNVGEDVIRKILRNNLKYIKYVISKK
ncbi:hypothetical protein [Flavobacterium sp.]|uniref:hypothetical protein n=1 Tax=Flavobacterium sp. TaxID=239 RepID=UPI0031E00D51